MNVDVALCLPRDAETVGLVRKVTADALMTFGVAESCIDDILLALSEACTNVLDHAAVEDEYEVRVQVDVERCELSIKNTGNGFDAHQLADVMPDGDSPRGRGVAIMRAVMDHVNFVSEPEAGTIVHLVKGLSVRDGGPLARLRERRRAVP